MAEETSTIATEEVAPKKAKVEKVKPPALEELPFEEFITQHYLPNLSKALTTKGITDLDLKFKTSEQPEIRATWQNKLRQFVIYFSSQDINGHKAFACADGGSDPRIIEPFLVDERKATLDLMVFGVMQRLNAQKWLAAN
jgi:hypothetical protein